MKIEPAVTPCHPNPNNPYTRLYFLDNLKTLTILLVVFFHSAYAYSIYYSIDWYVVDTQKSFFFDVFITIAFAFMMPVMFFVAGYFGNRSLARKGLLSFWRDKFYRIIIPWALGVVILAPARGYMYSLSRICILPIWVIGLITFLGKSIKPMVRHISISRAC